MMPISTSQCLSILAAPSYPKMGAIICFVINAAVLVQYISVFESNSVSHLCSNTATSIPASRERSGNIKMFTALINTLGSYV